MNKKLILIIYIFLFNQILLAQENIDSLKQIARTSSGIQKIKALNHLCYAYAYINADTARILGQQAFQLQNNEPTALLAETLHYLAITHQVQSQYEKALDLDKQSLAISTQLKDSLAMANTLNNIAVIFDEQGLYQDAIQHYVRAYQLYKKVGTVYNLALVNVNLGVVYKGIEDYTNSINNYRDALQKFTSLNKDYEKAVCLVNLGSVFISVNRYDSALLYSLQAEEAFRKLGYTRFQTVAIGNAGIAYGKLGQTKEGIYYLQQAIDLHQKNNNTKELSFCYLKLAELYLSNRKANEAIEAAQLALQKSAETKIWQQQAEAHHLLATLYDQNKNFKQALYHQKNYVQLKDSLFQKEKVKQIRELQIQYETEKKERALAESKVSIAQAELEIRKRDNQILSISLSVIAFIIGVVIYFRHEKSKQQKLSLKAELAEARTQNALQEERIRISQELHDNIGSQLTFVNASLDSLQLNFVPERLKEVKNLTSETIRELRKTVWLMNHESATLDEVVIKLRDYVVKGSPLPVVVQSGENLHHKIPAQLANHLFRFVQEALTNIYKHAHANKVEISIGTDATQHIEINIVDDGIGFNPSEKFSGIGLHTMRKRIEDLQGHFTIHSEPGRTHIHANLPV